MSPDEIRELRGELSREEFATMIGVTPLTVYRWELDVAAPESRRPQRRILGRLRALTKTQPQTHPVNSRPEVIPFTEFASPSAPKNDPPKTSAEKVPGVVSRVFSTILDGQWQIAEIAVLEVFADPELKNAGQVLGQAAHALLQLLWKNDVRGAWMSLTPALRSLNDDIPEEMAAYVHTVAALVFASPDGRIFSAGRVHSHVMRAERSLVDPDLRAMLRVAEMWAAYHLNDIGLLERVRAQSLDDTSRAQRLIARWMVWEIGSISSYLSGCVVEAVELFTQLIDAAVLHKLPLLAVRGSAYRAYVGLFAAETLEEVRQHISSANKLAREHRMEPGWPMFLLGACEAECLCREGRFDECLALIETLHASALTQQWPPIEVLFTWIRVLFLKGTLESGMLEGRLADFQGGHRSSLQRAMLTFADGLIDFAQQRLPSAASKLAMAAELQHESGTVIQLESYCFSMAFYLSTLARDSNAAANYLRRAEQSLDRVPLYWSTAALRMYKGVEAAMDGRSDEANQHGDASELAFRRVGDQAQALLAGRLKAMNAFFLGAEDAILRLEQDDAAWAALGLTVPPMYRRESVEQLRDARYAHPRGMCATRDVVFSGAHLLATYINRLTVRGMSTTQILQELFEVAVDLHGIPEPTVSIEEIGEQGPVVLKSQGKPNSYMEFGDGSGRRYRLGVSASIPPDQHTALNLLTQVASLAVEASSARIMSNPVRTAIADDLPPEVSGLIAHSHSMKTLAREIVRLGNSRASVLIHGESGSGKEVIAHAVYKSSNRKNRAFVTFNCAAVPRELFEGQLFGYRKGAFTGATSHHPGVIRAADGGTLFLDEIGDLPLDVQPKLLRFLENGEVFPLGETRPLKVDVRVIAATHRDLEQMVREGTFREDLYYRLAVVSLDIKPLRERREDIAPLARHFIHQFVEDDTPVLGPDAIARLEAHSWPGNVRELRNVIERSLAYSPLPEVIHATDLRI